MVTAANLSIVDKNILSTVFLNHHASLIAIARRRLGDSYLAQEAVSKTYLTLLVKWDKFTELKNQEECYKLTKRILDYKIQDGFREISKAKKSADLESIASATIEKSENCLREVSSLINKTISLADLTIQESTILPYVIKGCPPREIADILGITPEEVSKPKSTLLRKLRKVVQRNKNGQI